ncbi:germination protein YpeB [Tepidibacillus infernus]|uniref:germination protein YpeB n=1 Tax=Tepidibacillus TaxID=1494427 RepID=UPI00085397D9|nr:germination protein YpeB [Tepidibacillus sp. HK-1]GBF11679.1 sporulation protein YpeB [Tepidibacillus sp. HK-1]
MYKGITGILIPVLVIAVIGAGFWGYQENQEKNSILIKAENQYQRAFHDLNFHIDALHDELGKTLAVNSRRQLSPSLANVWRLAYSAQSDVGQLPLTLMPFSKTEEFLAKIGDFSYRIAIRDLGKEPLTDQEYKTLKTLYERSKEIRNELNHVQTEVIDKQLRWMDVEIALAEEDKKMDNTIIDGFKTIDKKVQEFPELDWGPEMMSLEKKNKEKGKNLKGRLITAEEAKKKAAEFMKVPVSDQIKVDKTGKGSNFEAFSVQIKGKNIVNLDVTKVGGHVVWMIINREIDGKKISLEQATEKANAFLQKRGYTSMVPTTIDQYDNSLIFTYAYKQNGVVVYPDMLSVKVALDNGEIIGFESTGYTFNHKKRVIPSPTITKETVQTKVNPHLKIFSIRPALIENSDGKEVLTYEVTGDFDKVTYRIYINAQNGEEEVVEKVEEDIVS